MTEYSVRVNQIGGYPTVVDLSHLVTRGQWRHDLDRIGEAIVTAESLDTACCERLAQVRPWLHELTVQRDGHDVFVGPIVRPLMPVQSGGSLEITAGDMPVWFTVRFAREARDWTVTGQGAQPVSTIVAELINMALGPADPNMLGFTVVEACGTLHERTIDVTSGIPREIVWKDHLDPIIGSLMSMSVHGRETLFYCVNGYIGALPAMTELDFVTIPPMLRDGDRFATSVAVIGDTVDIIATETAELSAQLASVNVQLDAAPTDASLIAQRDQILSAMSNVATKASVAGVAGGINPWGVLVERVVKLPGYVDQTSCIAAAGARVTRDVPLTSFDVADDERLIVSCDSELHRQFHKIRPGLWFDLTTGGCVPQGATVRVDSVGATWAGNTEQPFIGVSQLV